MVLLHSKKLKDKLVYNVLSNCYNLFMLLSVCVQDLIVYPAYRLWFAPCLNATEVGRTCLEYVNDDICTSLTQDKEYGLQIGLDLSVFVSYPRHSYLYLYKVGIKIFIILLIF